jgi:DNA polymerase III epsilon subunit-like protein
MFIIFGVEALPHSSNKGPEVFEVAAIAMAPCCREMAAFESLVRPSEEALWGLRKEALEMTGLSVDDLRSAPVAADAANRLRAFINANHATGYVAYNVRRARRLLGDKPWELAKPWEGSIRERVIDILPTDEIPDIKLYEAALFLKIPVPIKRRALSSARLCAEILGKMERGTHNISDANFLREAEYTMEEGL